MRSKNFEEKVFLGQRMMMENCMINIICWRMILEGRIFLNGIMRKYILKELIFLWERIAMWNRIFVKIAYI